MFIIAVFNNKTNCLMFSRLLTKSNVANDIISTPNGLGSSCGISVRFMEKHYNVANFILKKNSISAFNGFYKVVKNFNKIQYVKLSF